MTEGPARRSPGPQRIFDGTFLRATFWQPAHPATTLYVTFRQRLPDPGRFDETGPVRQALSRGFAHLHLQSRWNDWYLNDETEALEAALAGLRSGFVRAWAIGYSMGGYGALRLSRGLGLNRVLLISPQVSLDRSVVPLEDRYPEAADFDSARGDLRQVASPGLEGVLAIDPFRRADLAHARLAQVLFPGLALARLSFGGHPATGVLREGGMFRSLQALSMADQMPAAEVVRLHRGLRSGSQRYWRARAATCRKAGHPDAARIAEARLAGLVQQVSG
ncbi:MAG: alpha/beta hydrolase [Paracoccaceae bacterium]|nr:alpha/beta hydrolase [Paracoccaceae bacterium]